MLICENNTARKLYAKSVIIAFNLKTTFLNFKTSCSITRANTAYNDKHLRLCIINKFSETTISFIQFFFSLSLNGKKVKRVS